MPPTSTASALYGLQQLFRYLTTIQPKEAKITIGLDIGSTSIKAVALGSRKGGGPRLLLSHQLVPLPQGHDDEISEFLKQTVEPLHAPTHTVNLSVSGQWVIMRIVEMITMKPEEMRRALPFEAQRYMPFNIQDVVIDGVALGPSDATKTWVLIVACKKDLLERRMDWIKRAGLEVALVDVDALAIANGFLASSNGRRPDETCAIVNIGAQLTNLVIFHGQLPYLVRDIPWGGEKLIRNTAEQLGRQPAEIVKAWSEGPPSPEILGAMKLACEILVTELQLSFDYFENRFGQPPETILVSGGLGLCPGFLDVLKSHLTQAVTLWTPLEGLTSQFAVAYGLALRTS